jgi:hypothetical protein
LLAFAPVLGSIAPNAPYDARFDLNGDGRVNGSDFLKLAPFLSQTCVDAAPSGLGDNCPDDAINDMDNDGVCTGTTFAPPMTGGNDNCPAWFNPTQALPNWSVPAGDSDCDGFPDSVPLGPPSALSAELLMGTDPVTHCAATSDRNDEPNPDRWPVDFDDNQSVNGSDLLAFAPVFGAISPNPLYDARFDLNADGRIHGSDFLKLAPFMAHSCAP